MKDLAYDVPKKKGRLTVAIIKRIVEEAQKYKIQPIRYKSSDAILIKKGLFKGQYKLKKGAKPDNRGKISVYAFLTNNSYYMIKPEGK